LTQSDWNSLLSPDVGRKDPTDGLSLATDAVAALSELMGVHGGGLELVQLSQTGVAKVRFTGMCQGCIFRPLTMAATIRPILLQVESIVGVEADGARISDEALERITHWTSDNLSNPIGRSRRNESG
jgi:Fe-S cluster biogenesis protein NfuA